ncbi:MAG: glycosyltransferase family 4 protein [Bacteroidota bacterium]|nr:glycosyltransferase family 4 protein [Bacteroidota bacterium]
MKRKKIFLAGLINVTNAQNINCFSLAKYLDKNKFKVYTLEDKSKESALGISGVSIFSCGNLFRVQYIIALIWGILKSDIIYFPKHQTTPIFCLRICKFLNKKVFTTIEGNMCDKSKINMIDNFGGQNKMLHYFNLIPNIFGITKYIIDNANCGVKLNKKVLYLGVDLLNFPQKKNMNELKNIVFIGSLISRKKVHEIIDLANFFQELNFHIVGDGPLKEDLLLSSSSNITFYGNIPSQELNKYLLEMDLLFLPSRSEGFPKVILEGAASGVPSLVYDAYGAREWIDNNSNGFVVVNYEEVVSTIKKLINNPILLQDNSKGALRLSKKFDWEALVKDWEKSIFELV